MRLWKAIFLIITIPLLYWIFLWPHYSWHQKLTVEIQKNDQIFSGSSVVYVFWNKNIMHSMLGMGPAWHSTVIGESTIVKLPNNKYLVAILNYPAKGHSNYAANIAIRAISKTTKNYHEKKEFLSVLASRGISPIALQTKNYPPMISFKNIEDPTSVVKIRPSKNIRTVIDPNIEIKKITLEITFDPITKGNLARHINWLKKVNGKLKPSTKRFVMNLSPEERVSIRDILRIK